MHRRSCNTWGCHKHNELAVYCLEAGQFAEGRLEPLVAKALDLALADYGREHFAEDATNHRSRKKRKSSDKESMANSLADIAMQRRSWQDLYVARKLITIDDLTERLRELDAKERTIVEQLDASERQSAPAALPAFWTRTEWTAASANIVSAWSNPADLPMDWSKYEILSRLGITLRVGFAAKPEVHRKAGNDRRYKGRLQLTLEIAKLGLVGPETIYVEESEDDWNRWNRERGQKANKTRWD